MSAFLDLARSRYSCRHFSQELVPSELIDQILAAAQVAPTGKNLQPWHAWVIKGEDSLALARECTRCHFDAPLLIVVGARPQDAWMRPYDGRNIADVDAAIVATHIMLEAHDLGLATTWVAHFNAPKLAACFPEMQGYDLIALFPVGYAAQGAQASSLHSTRKPVQELVSYL